MRTLFAVLSAVVLAAGVALADDVATMPTANQLRAGETDIAWYHISLDLPPGAPQSVSYQTLCLGLTNRFELDVHRSAVDKDRTSVIFVGSYKLLSENATRPDLVIGARNLLGAATTDHPLFKDKSRDRSYFLSAAKTFFLRPTRPGPPAVRAHVSVGTSDWTVLTEKRHQGLFGGVQILLHPVVGISLLHDGQDMIAGIALMPKNSGLTLKGGTLGKHAWVGCAYRRSL